MGLRSSKFLYQHPLLRTENGRTFGRARVILGLLTMCVRGLENGNDRRFDFCFSARFPEPAIYRFYSHFTIDYDRPYRAVSVYRVFMTDAQSSNIEYIL